MATANTPLNRSLVVRVGKRLRKRINPYIKSHSKISNRAIFDRADFPWLPKLEENWEIIRSEADALMQFKDAIPQLSDISPDHAKLDHDKKWRAYFLWGYGFKSSENCARCPKTAEILKTVPGLTTALFSIHAPGMTIAPHKGVTAGVCVVHLGLKIPDDRGNCAIRVDQDIVSWEEGKAFAFDDTLQHETWNRTDQERIILLLHVKRPVRFPGSLVAWLFMTGIRASPFIGDARRKMKEWDKKFSDRERK